MNGIAVSSTTSAIVGQMKENTGRSILDSGDAYGRGYERKASVPIEAFIAAPAVRVDEYGVTVDAMHWLADRVEYHEQGDAFFQEWVERDDEALDEYERRPWLVSAERFAAWLLTGDPEGEPDSEVMWTYNTYNGESLLSETLLWVVFRTKDCPHEPDEDGYLPGGLIPDEDYLLLQTHNGCDVRGGYSSARLYSLTGYDGWYSLYDLDSFELAHDHGDCDYYLSYRSEWIDSDGSFLTDPWEGLTKGVVSEGGDAYTSWPLVRVGDGVAIQCPRCFLPMTALPYPVG